MFCVLIAKQELIEKTATPAVFLKCLDIRKIMNDYQACPRQVAEAQKVMLMSGIDYVGTRINPNGGSDLPDNPVAAVMRFAQIKPPIINEQGILALRAVGIKV